MKYAVDIIVRVMVEADSPEAAHTAACQPSVDWNKARLIDVDAIPEDCIIECAHCDAIVVAFDYGYDDRLRHTTDCPAAKPEVRKKIGALADFAQHPRT